LEKTVNLVKTLSKKRGRVRCRKKTGTHSEGKAKLKKRERTPGRFERKEKNRYNALPDHCTIIEKAGVLSIRTK